MEMTGERTLSVNRATAWAALNDVSVLQNTIPGCESIVASAPNEYDLVMNAAIGPVKARFKGHMTLADVEAPKQYTIRFEGQGGQAGFARGDAKVSLEERSSQQTLLRYAVTANVGGRLAQAGSRLIDAAAASMADQFFAAFSSQLSSAAAAAPPPAPAKLSFWTLLKAFFKRLFGGSQG
jgi:carbon monoxide dehydrogenase subunit G